VKCVLLKVACIAMNTRIIFSITAFIISLFLLTACKREKIKLEKVRALPDYMYIKKHFGYDLKSMEERNDFLLVTGTIDTTTETPPADVAVIMIDKQQLILHKTKSVANSNEVKEIYSGSGYSLLLEYTKTNKHLFTSYEGELEISKPGAESAYHVVGVDGYH
jgi:hypothetical protein